MNLSLADSRRAGSTVVLVAGELDIETAPALRSHVLALVREGQSVVLDLTDLSFMDSSGLQVLLSSQRRAELVGVSFALRGLPPQVRHLFELTNLLGHFAVVESPTTDLRDGARVAGPAGSTPVGAPLPRPSWEHRSQG